MANTDTADTGGNNATNTTAPQPGETAPASNEATTGPNYSNLTTGGTSAVPGTTSTSPGAVYTPPSAASSAYEYEEYASSTMVTLGSIGPLLGLSATQPQSVSTVLEAFSHASHAVVLQIESKMNQAGLYSAAGLGAAENTPVQLGTIDQNSMQTLSESLISAANAKSSFGDYLTNQIQTGAGANENQVIPSANVSTGSADNLQLTNPNDLEQTLYQAYESELGRAPTDAEINAFVKQYQGQQTTQQMGEFKANQAQRYTNYQGQNASRGAQLNAETSPRVANGAVSQNITSPATYANALLSYMGVPQTSNNVQAITAWINSLGNWGNGSHNPLGLDQGTAGSATATSGHQTYQNFQQSIQAAAAELQSYPYVMAALQNGNLSSSMTSNSGTKAEINKVTNGNGQLVEQNLNAAAVVAKQNKQTKLKNASHANKQAKAKAAQQAATNNAMPLMQKVTLVHNAATAHGTQWTTAEQNEVVDALQQGANVNTIVSQVQNGQKINVQAAMADNTSASGGDNSAPTAVNSLLSAATAFIKATGATATKAGKAAATARGTTAKVPLNAPNGLGELGNNPKPGIENQIPENAGGNGPNINSGSGPSYGNPSGGGIMGSAGALASGANNINNPTQWAQSILAQMGDPETQSNINFLTSWAAQEGGNWNNTAKFNPLNTTQQMPGSSVMSGGNSAGVQSYGSWEEGNAATVKTLEGYKEITAALKKGNASEEDQNGNLSAAFQRWSGGEYSQVSIKNTPTSSQSGSGSGSGDNGPQNATPAQDTSPTQNPGAPGDMFIPDTVTTDVQAPDATDMAEVDARSGANAVPFLGNQYLQTFGAVADMIKAGGITASGGS